MSLDAVRRLSGTEENAKAAAEAARQAPTSQASWAGARKMLSAIYFTGLTGADRKGLYRSFFGFKIAVADIAQASQLLFWGNRLYVRTPDKRWAPIDNYTMLRQIYNQYGSRLNHRMQQVGQVSHLDLRDPFAGDHGVEEELPA
jgi:hypothetical protein